jgi:hypothetical protein
LKVRKLAKAPLPVMAREEAKAASLRDLVRVADVKYVRVSSVRVLHIFVAVFLFILPICLTGSVRVADKTVRPL